MFFTSEVRTETSETSVERNVQTRLHTVPVGLILLLTPSVAADDEIILKIRPTVTRESGFVVDPNPELAAASVVSRIPEIAIREIESVLRLRSGEVAVLGGLMREEAREDTTGVPFLSRLPGIGAAFRYRDRAQDKTELIVFLRPTVVRDPALAGDLAKYRRWWPAADGPASTGTGGGTGLRGRGLGHGQASENAATWPPALQAPASSGPDDPGRLRIDRSWAGNPADALLGRPGRRSRAATTVPRGPPTSGRWTRARRRRFPASPPPRSAREGMGRPARGTSVWPPSIRRTRSGGRYRSCSTAVRVRPLASGRLRGGPRSPQRRPGSRWRSETPSPIRASGRRRRTRIGRPAGPRLRAPTRRTTSR